MSHNYITITRQCENDKTYQYTVCPHCDQTEEYIEKHKIPCKNEDWEKVDDMIDSNKLNERIYV